MRGALEAAPGVETVRYEATEDRFIVRYRDGEAEASAFAARVAGVVILPRGRRLLEEVGHRMGVGKRER